MHQFPGGPTVKSNKIGIGSVQFVSAKEASSRFLQDEPLGVSDNSLVCYVVVQGPFILSQVSYPTGMHMKEFPTAKTGVEVFDAQTGNLLLWGA